MRRNFFNAVALIALILSLVNLGQGSVAQGINGKVSLSVPTMISYQGYVTVNGTPYNGAGYFKFAVVDSLGTENFWANDGTYTGEPANAVQLPVSDGLFSVRLGDTSLGGGMTSPVVTWVFSVPERFLRIWFSPSGEPGSFTRLAPDRPFTSTPYAMLAEKAGDADSLGGYAASSYQQRVSDPCPPGFAILQVTEYGSVLCQVVEARPVFSINTLDFDGSVGKYTSMVIGADGLGLISYYDTGDSNLRVAHCQDTACTTAWITALDSDGAVGLSSSITIGADGLGWISYFEAGAPGGLKLAHCNDLACTSAAIRNLELVTTWDENISSSIALGSDGLLVIAYIDGSTLKVLHCNDADCTQPHIRSLGIHTSRHYPSLTIGVDGLPLISNVAGDLDLELLHCEDLLCDEVTITSLDSREIDYATSITIGGDGLGLVSYYEVTSGLNVAHCNDLKCQTATLTSLDSESAWRAGRSNAITVGWDGLGLISYYDHTNQDLKIAHCRNAACSQASITRLLAAGNVGQYSSIVIGADGMGLVSYYDEGERALKVIHLANQFGTPWVRRR